MKGIRKEEPAPAQANMAVREVHVPMSNKWLVGLAAIVIYLGLWVVVVVVQLREMNPLLALPPICVAFAVLAYVPWRRRSSAQKQFFASIDVDSADAVRRSERIALIASGSVGAVGVWAIVTNAAPWLSGRIMAITDPGARFYYAQYPGSSMLALCVCSVAASVLVDNAIAPRLGGPHRDAWRRYWAACWPRNKRLLNWVAAVLFIASLVLLPPLLSAGVSVSEKGIVLHRLGRSSFYGWDAVDKVRSPHHSQHEVLFSDGSAWAIEDSTWNRSMRTYPMAKYVSERAGSEIDYSSERSW